MANVEQPPKLMGRAVTMTLAPLPASKRRRKFAKSDHLPEDVDDHDDDDEITADDDVATEAPANP
jgi:translation initiation factor IF-3